MTDNMLRVAISSECSRILPQIVADYTTHTFRSTDMTTAHEECSVTYDKYENVSKKRKTVLSNSVCKIPKAFL